MQYDLAQLINEATAILILQADNPDGDSLASALALEQILGDLGKEPYMYCGVDMPAHLRYLPGWDRVSNELPKQFDMSIIVDTSAISLFEQAAKNNLLGAIKSKPVVIIDHHDVDSTIDFAELTINEHAVSTGEVIYGLAKALDWPLKTGAKDMLAVSIMSDSLGLTTDATTAHSIRVIADLVEGGVKLAQLESSRRALQGKSPELTRYKGELLQRVQYHAEDRIATVVIPWDEIERYSAEYNPSILVMDDMRQTINTAIAIAFKTYKDGKMTGKIRCNYGFPIANDLAGAFGGGGHPYASGFKISDGRSLEQVLPQVIAKTTELLNELPNATV